MCKAARVSKSAQSKQRIDRTKSRKRFRSTLVAFYSLFREIRLRKTHIDLLQQTSFWHIFDAFLEKRVKFVKKFDEPSIRLISQYNREDNMFSVGPHRMRITRSDIALIFGIADGDRRINTNYTTKHASAFISRRFANDADLRTPVIRRALVDAVGGKRKTDTIDTVRLLCLYLFTTILFSPGSDRLRWGYVNYVEDIKTICDYDWSSAVVDELMNSVDKSNSEPWKVTGCILALQVMLH